MFYTNKEPLINIKIWFSSGYRILINISNTIIQFFENVFLWIIYLILIIGVMIHNEIIIINICGLGSDTKYFLDIKVEIEQLYSDTDDPEILKRYETLDEMDDKDIGIDNIKKNGE